MLAFCFWTKKLTSARQESSSLYGLMKIIVILTLSISLFSYSFIRMDAVNAGENEVGNITPAVVFVALFFGGPVLVIIVLQIWAIYRTRGVWRIFAILPVAPVAFIFSFYFTMVGDEFFLLLITTPVAIVYLLFLHTIFISQRQKLTVI